MKKRLLSGFLAIVMLLSLVGFAFAAGAEDFSDVKEGQWYYEYVDDVADLGYFVGYPDGTFRPGNDITRAEVVLVLARMAQRLGLARGYDLDAKTIDEAPFEDVSTKEWYSVAVKWAADEGITLGVGNNKFAPHSPVTREDACTLICRFIDYVGEHKGTYYTEHYDASLIYEFEDEAQIRAYAAEAVDVCMAYGLVEGFTDHTFQPRSNWTRAQGAKMISILHDVLDVPDEPYIPPVYESHVGTLTYHVDGKTDLVPGETQTVKVLVGQTPEFKWAITDVVVYDADEDGVADYNILGWDTNPAATNPIFKYDHYISTATPDLDLYAVLDPIVETEDDIYVSKLVYVVDGKEDIITVDPQTTTVPAGADVSEMSVKWTVTNVAAYVDGDGNRYAITGWDTDPAADTVVWEASKVFDAAVGSTVKLYAVLKPVDKFSFELTYSVDGKTDVIAAQTYEDYDALEHAFDISNVADYDKNDDGEPDHIILGWDTAATADTVVYEVGGEIVVGANQSVTLYAVLVPLDDYIKLAVLGAIEDANDYVAKAEELTITAGSHDATVGNFLTADEITLDLNTHTVNVAVTGELNSDTVVNVIALATEYAVAILGPDEDLPTVDEVKDVVVDVADSVGVDITEQTAKEIAMQVYDKLHAVGADLLSNFRNFNGGYCINKITLKSGDKDVASLNVTNDKGLTTDGADASKAAAKELAIAVAKAMYADLKTQSGSAITLKASIVVEFGTDCPGYDETKADYKGYSDTYTLDLALTVKSDMYRYDGATNTLTLVITDNLQHQYAESLEQVMTATLENEAVQAQLTNLVKNALDKAGLVDSLGSLAAKDAVDAAIDLWIAANLKAEAADPIDTPYEFLWTKEGTIVDNGNGTYSTSTGTILGDNAALYALVETVYRTKLDDMIADVDASDLSGDVIKAINELVGADKVSAAFDGWKMDNGMEALDSETAYTLYNFLYNGGKINDDYTLGNLTEKKLGVNDSLYTLYVDLTDVATKSAMEEAEESLGAGWANATPEEKVIVVKVAVDSVISGEDYVAFTGSIREYLLNMCMAKAASDLGLDASAYEAKAEEQKGAAYDLIDEMLIKGLYNATNDSDYAEYVGLDKAGRAGMVDQMILKALATTTVKGKTLDEYLALAYHVKTIERMATVELNVFAGLLNNATFQNVAAQYGNEYVHYLATVITKLPDNASLIIDGVVISEATLEAVKTAAANNDTKAVCTELAKIIDKLGYLSMNEIEAEPLTVTVKYGNRSATMNIGLDIE